MDDSEDFNIPSEQRRALLRDLESVLGDLSIPCHWWATFILCDIERLKGIVEKIRLDPAVEQLGIPSCWTLLRCWWSEEKVKRWVMHTLNGPGNSTAPVKTLQNLITLSCSLHAYWTCGGFVLRPEPERPTSNKEMKVQFL
ncbi:uncharacterized protein BO97DRAFT_460938 [Aspergillus homomorphus CBS 101889]|uniref:HNH nuclease domain-containing protein n=1 Tax=Aspergillus homomorphus (strain CBS 101889) TaxID=1450537 RepID=A0A395I5V8_ASPHC|nr:hypothetical protein BO97DRAFT_460938 [Aspergillus homomorphus CBS 101889]RAL15387.1 hypothetical protein BO97DRAFT_460938 [Aspergillus homomorphus CBS 101889]